MKKLGFGCMRLPMQGDEVDLVRFSRMIDSFLAAGFRYFDTARVYLDGKSETALRDCLVRRYPRNAYFLTDKLSGSQVKTAADIRPFFMSQLESLGVSYLDGYLMHAMNAETYARFCELDAFTTVRALKKEGYLRHYGISFHDKPAVLEKILTEQPDIEAVQIQLNYLDYESPSIESRAVYEVCCRFDKPVLVMEPLRGGGLASLPEEAEKRLAALGTGTPVSYALRFAASFERVQTVLSGMSTPEQMEENIRFLQELTPLSEAERCALEDVCEILRRQDAIACTGCRYCVAGCPQKIVIPELFACYNNKRRFDDWSSETYYEVCTRTGGDPKSCLHCHRCEKSCPQHLEIPALLEKVTAAFEK